MEENYTVDELGLGPLYAKFNVLKKKAAIIFCEQRLKEIPNSYMRYIHISQHIEHCSVESVYDYSEELDRIAFFWSVLLKGLKNKPNKLYKHFPESKHCYNRENFEKLAEQEQYGFYDTHSFYDPRDFTPDAEASIMSALKDGEDV